MTKNLKHVQLFESYVDFKKGFKGPIEIGIYGEGGYGVHPAIVDEKGAKIINGVEENYSPIISLPRVPEALLYIVDYKDPSDTWKFFPLSRTEAMELGGKQSYNVSSDPWLYGKNADPSDPIITKMLSKVGYKPADTRGEVTFDIGIIDSPKVNTVYWSDLPEQNYGLQWGIPYEEISVMNLRSV